MYLHVIKDIALFTYHPGLTRVKGIRFLLFEINRVLICLLNTLYSKRICRQKKYLRKKAEKLCLIGEIVIESDSFLKY